MAISFGIEGDTLLTPIWIDPTFKVWSGNADLTEG